MCVCVCVLYIPTFYTLKADNKYTTNTTLFICVFSLSIPKIILTPRCNE